MHTHHVVPSANFLKAALRAADFSFCTDFSSAGDKRSRRRLPVNKNRPVNGYGGQVHDGEEYPRGCPSAGATDGSVVANLSRGDSLSSHGRLNMNCRRHVAAARLIPATPLQRFPVERRCECRNGAIRR